MTRDLTQPLILSEAGGITLLTGRNVALAPGRLAAIMARMGDPPCHRDGTPFVAFATGRSGMVGFRGVASPSGEGTVLREVEAFGSQAGIEAFAERLASFLCEPRRFARVARVDPGSPGGGLLSRALGRGLSLSH